MITKKWNDNGHNGEVELWRMNGDMMEEKRMNDDGEL